MVSTIWTELYRPHSFEEFKGQKEIVDKVRAFVEQKNMPHLLFSGPAGVGKTTLALIIGRQLFKDSFRENFLELNASDERGIDVVRNKVKDFARTKSIGDFPFKIIYLDESDALTKEAQQALRRTMENYTQTCRFILSCNYSSKIIDPIQSRCAVFRFKPLAREEILKILDTIAKKEGLTVTQGAKEAIFIVSEGDCRRMENILQSSAVLEKNIKEEMIYSIASFARPKDLKKVLELALANKFLESRSLLLDVMLNYGLSGADVVKQLQREVWDLTISDKKKLKLIERCAAVDFHIVEGSDEFLQLESYLAYVALIGSE